MAVVKQFNPLEATGVDASLSSTDFCNRVHNSGVKWVHGFCDKLPFENDSFDVVINVESSHCYDDFGQFLNEVHTTLTFACLLSKPYNDPILGSPCPSRRWIFSPSGPP